MADNDFSTLFDLLPIGAYRSSPQGQQIRANPALVKLDGYETEAELLAATTDLAQEWYVDPTRREHFKALLHAYGKVLGLVSEVYRHRSRERIWVRVHAHLVRNAQGEILYYEGTVEDITGEHLVRQALQASEARFRSLTEMSSDWYWEQDTEFRFTRIDVGEDIGNAVVNKALGKTRQELDECHLGDAWWEAHHAVLRAHAAFKNLEFESRNMHGQMAWHSVSGEPMFDAIGKFTGYRGVGRDITERKRDEEVIRQLAFHDPLTGLPNRRLLMDRLQQSLVASQRSQHMGALLFLDLDNFKSLNDALGHDAGDKLLQQVGKRLQACVRAADTVSRLGGDEFVVLLENAGLTRETAAAHAARVAEKIQQALCLPFQLGDQAYQGSASMGAVVLADPAQNAETYLKQADTAMYQAKSAGRDAVRRSSPA